ncbi:Ly-6-related family-containing protein [Aphelenchoides besseyi]|nr:Ly-6-related family-containing protein [Aphelenchoides besseyi]
MQCTSLPSVIFFVLTIHTHGLLDYPPHMSGDFPEPISQLNDRESEYFSPNGPQTQSPDSDEDGFFMKGPLIDHPFYQKQTPSVYAPSIFDDIPPSDTVKCFSCMSKFYEFVWPALSHVYKKPMNFTDNCNDENIDQRLVPVTNCPTICVAMSEESTESKYADLFVDVPMSFFTMVSIKRSLRGIVGCIEIRVVFTENANFFKLPTEQSDDSSISVCTCYSDHCNIGIDSASTQMGQMCILILCLFASLL